MLQRRRLFGAATKSMALGAPTSLLPITDTTQSTSPLPLQGRGSRDVGVVTITSHHLQPQCPNPVNKLFPLVFAGLLQLIPASSECQQVDITTLHQLKISSSQVDSLASYEPHTIHKAAQRAHGAIAHALAKLWRPHVLLTQLSPARTRTGATTSSSYESLSHCRRHDRKCCSEI